MKMPAIRACIGDWVYYVATMTFQNVSTYVKKVDDELHKSELLKDLLQRSITDNYKSIARYIETQQERFFNALVLAIYDGDPLWHEVRLEYDDGEEFYDLGILELSGEEKIFPVDGQHRVEGIKEVVRNSNAYNAEQIPVIFISHKTSNEGMQRSRRLFSTLNRYAKPVSMRDIIALDEDDIVAIISRELIDNHPLFSAGRLLDSKTKAIPEANITAFTTIITFYECNFELLSLLVKNIEVYDTEGKKTKGRTKLKEFIKKRPSDETITQFHDICRHFWDALIASCPVFQEYLAAEPDSQPYRNRDGGHLLFRPVALMPFVRAVVKAVSVSGRSFEEVFALFPQSLFSINNILWRNVIWNSEKKTMIMNNKQLTERLMLYYLDSNLLSENEHADMLKDIKALKMLVEMEDVHVLLSDAVTSR